METRAIPQEELWKGDLKKVDGGSLIRELEIRTNGEKRIQRLAQEDEVIETHLIDIPPELIPAELEKRRITQRVAGDDIYNNTQLIHIPTELIIAELSKRPGMEDVVKKFVRRNDDLKQFEEETTDTLLTHLRQEIEKYWEERSLPASVRPLLAEILARELTDEQKEYLESIKEHFRLE